MKLWKTNYKTKFKEENRNEVFQDFLKGGLPFSTVMPPFKLALLNSFRVQLSQLVLVDSRAKKFFLTTFISFILPSSLLYLYFEKGL